MMDRVLFSASRALWPLHNLIVLTAMGIAFGERGLADYTYALALCGPLYFLVAYSFPIFLLVDSKDGRYSNGLAWIRIATALSTVPIVFGIALFISSTQLNVIAAVWLLKI